MKKNQSRKIIIISLLSLLVLLIMVCLCKKRFALQENFYNEEPAPTPSFTPMNPSPQAPPGPAGSPGPQGPTRLTRQNVIKIIEEQSKKNNIKNPIVSKFTGQYIIERFECDDINQLVSNRNLVLDLIAKKDEIWNQLMEDDLNDRVANVIKFYNLSDNTTINDIGGYMKSDDKWIKVSSGIVLTVDKNNEPVAVSSHSDASEIIKQMDLFVNAKNKLETSLAEIEEKIQNYNSSNCIEGFTGKVRENFEDMAHPPSWSGNCKYEDVLAHKLAVQNKKQSKDLEDFGKKLLKGGDLFNNVEIIFGKKGKGDDSKFGEYLKINYKNELKEAIKGVNDNNINDITSRDFIDYYFFNEIRHKDNNKNKDKRKDADGNLIYPGLDDQDNNNTPFHYLLSGRRVRENGKSTKVFGFNEEGKLVKKNMPQEFDTQYLEGTNIKDGAPFWYRVHRSDNSFTKDKDGKVVDYNLESIDTLQDLFNKIIKNKADIIAELAEEEAKDPRLKRWVPCMNLDDLDSSVSNNKVLIENFADCNKKETLGKRLKIKKTAFGSERSEYWKDRELINLMESLIREYNTDIKAIKEYLGNNNLSDEEAFAKLADTHEAKKKWLDGQERIMNKYVKMKEELYSLQHQYNITPASTMWDDCDTTTQIQTETQTETQTEKEDICPSPSGCGGFNEMPVFSTTKLKTDIQNKLKSILGNNLGTVNFEEAKYYYTITINKSKIENVLDNKQKRDKIESDLKDIFYKHLRDLYVSTNNSKYNVAKEQLKIMIMRGSLKIVLEILSDEYILGPSKSEEEKDLSDMEEYKRFMSSFTTNGSTENIIQFEPEGVSGIFAPYIKIV